jgi:hypothetical protein
MKTESPLLECFAKIEWAETAINDLKIKIDTLFKPAPNLNIFAPVRFPGDKPRRSPMPYPTGLHKSVKHVDSNGIEVWRYVFPDIPTSLNVSVGAILHNLRSPLDQMLSTIAVQTHDSPRGVSFPFGRDRKEFQASLDKQTKLIANVRNAIAILKPYKTGGNSLLYALHALNNPDKHHPGLVPINVHTGTRVTAFGVHRGMLLSIGPRTGRHFAVDMDNNFSQSDRTKQPGVVLLGEMTSHFIVGDTGKTPLKFNSSRSYNQTGSKPRPDLAEWIAKAKLPPGAPKDDMEIATCIPGTDFEIEASPSFNIALGDIEGFEREPVVAVLHQMRQLVQKILLTFESPSEKFGFMTRDLRQVA